MSFELYKHFDEQGDLLYIGISHSAFMRLAGHKRDSHWFNEIASVEIYRYGSLTELREAERELIFLEKPKHNKVHKKYINADLLHEMVMNRTWSRDLTFDEVRALFDWDEDGIYEFFPPMNPEDPKDEQLWCPIEAAHIRERVDKEHAEDLAEIMALD